MFFLYDSQRRLFLRDTHALTRSFAPPQNRTLAQSVAHALTSFVMGTKWRWKDGREVSQFGSVQSGEVPFSSWTTPISTISANNVKCFSSFAFLLFFVALSLSLSRVDSTPSRLPSALNNNGMEGCRCPSLSFSLQRMQRRYWKCSKEEEAVSLSS